MSRPRVLLRGIVCPFSQLETEYLDCPIGIAKTHRVILRAILRDLTASRSLRKRRAILREELHGLCKGEHDSPALSSAVSRIEEARYGSIAGKPATISNLRSNYTTLCLVAWAIAGTSPDASTPDYSLREGQKRNTRPRRCASL